MSNHFSANFDPGPSKQHKKQWGKRSIFGFNAGRSKSWKNSSAEYVPLASGDCSDSDDELTVHDVKFLNVRQKGSTRSLPTNEVYSDKDINHDGSKSDPFLQCDFLPLELKKDDTLQSISIKYNCPISDLKRANNLISNQDFYGLRKLKIPVRKHGLLSEIIRDTQSDETAEGTGDARTISIGIGPMLSNSTPQEAAEFLRRMDEDLVKIMLNTKTKKDSLEEVAAALTAPTIQPLVEETRKDHDIRFTFLIVFMLVVAIMVPLIIILYTYYVKHSSNLASNSTGVYSHASTAINYIW